MEKFKFKPRLGMVTQDSYLHGANFDVDIGLPGVIECVGPDYFVLRVNNELLRLITKDSYWVVEEGDFE